jgi:hypothetical protein
MGHELRTEIDIAGPPEAVWAQLVDLNSYADWNPFITSAVGSAAVGERLTLRMQPPGGRPMTFRPTVTRTEPGAVFEWLGRLGVPGLFDGRHRFELTASPGGTHLVQSESFTGLLVGPLRRSLDRGTRAGFEAMNEALRRRVTEGRPRS